MSEQFPLDLPHASGFAAADFIAADSNSAARRLIEGWRDWPFGWAALWGASGAGKSHLADIWRVEAAASALDPTRPDALDLAALAAPWRYLLDFDAASLGPDAEKPLFHLLNIVRERGGALLLVSRAAPARWPVALPDLASRLRAMLAAEAAAPDDGLLAAVIAKQFADRQLVVERQTIDYLVARTERSFEAAQALVERIDRAALARRRRITTKLAGEVLAEIEAGRAEAGRGN